MTITVNEAAAIDRLKALIQEIYRESRLQITSVNVRWEPVRSVGRPTEAIIHSVDMETSKGY